MLHANEVMLAQRTPYRRLFPGTILREAVFQIAAWVYPAPANMADALASGVEDPGEFVGSTGARANSSFTPASS